MIRGFFPSTCRTEWSVNKVFSQPGVRNLCQRGQHWCLKNSPSIYNFVYILFNRSVWNNFGEGLRDNAADDHIPENGSNKVQHLHERLIRRQLRNFFRRCISVLNNTCITKCIIDHLCWKKCGFMTIDTCDIHGVYLQLQRWIQHANTLRQIPLLASFPRFPTKDKLVFKIIWQEKGRWETSMVNGRPETSELKRALSAHRKIKCY